MEPLFAGGRGRAAEEVDIAVVGGEGEGEAADRAFQDLGMAVSQADDLLLRVFVRVCVQSILAKEGLFDDVTVFFPCSHP